MEYLLQCLDQLLPHPSSLTLVFTLLFLTLFLFFSPLSVHHYFLLFLKYIFPEVPLPWLRGSAVSCDGSTGTSYV